MDFTTPTPPRFDIDSFCANPEIHDAAPAKIALLRGPIYFEEPAWIILTRYKDQIIRFFAEIGLRVIIDDEGGYAFLEQAQEGEAGGDWPKLLYRDRHSFDVTCVLIVLRGWLLTQETKTSDERTPLQAEELLDQLRPFSRKASANVEKEDKRWREAINRVVALGYLARKKGVDAFTVRPIVRAKVSLETLQELRVALEEHATKSNFREEQKESQEEGEVA